MEISLRRAGFRGRISPEAVLARHTTWRIGGPAELLAEPADREDLLLALAWARESGVRWRVLGNGSNLLVSDDGVRGLVLYLRSGMAEIGRNGIQIKAGAGAMLPALCKSAVACGLAGIELLSDIPGTIGGAVLMNAGVPEMKLGDCIDEVEYLEADGDIKRYGREACRFRYRGSRFSDGAGVILGARLRLLEEKPETIRKRMKDYTVARRKKQPTTEPSCGSVFVNPEGDSAGRLIEQAGFKGFRVGDVQVSPKHANFFVNVGAGSSADALALVDKVQREVEKRFGIRLQPEFKHWC
jgi:UDP-N-acetylmuramate dehydrogenase